MSNWGGGCFLRVSAGSSRAATYGGIWSASEAAFHLSRVRWRLKSRMPVKKGSRTTQLKPRSEKTPVFATTEWSVILAAGNESSDQAAEALERLCASYWYPLYAYVRRRGYGPQEAQDLTQAFFAHLFERKFLDRVSREKGRFRSFLLASMNYFLSDQRDRASARKRGGGQPVYSIDAEAGEQRYRHEPLDLHSPDKAFDRRWALTLLDRVLGRLRTEFASANKGRLFQALQVYLVQGSRPRPYAEAARELDSTEDAIKKAVQRMRRRYADLFREEIAQTVATPAEVDEELMYLCRLMAEG